MCTIRTPRSRSYFLTRLMFPRYTGTTSPCMASSLWYMRPSCCKSGTNTDTVPLETNVYPCDVRVILKSAPLAPCLPSGSQSRSKFFASCSRTRAVNISIPIAYRFPFSVTRWDDTFGQCSAPAFLRSGYRQAAPAYPHIDVRGSCWGKCGQMAKLEFLTWLRIGSGMLQVHKELGSVSLNCQLPSTLPWVFLPAKNDIE